MLYLAIVDKLNRAGFVVAPYNTPEEVPSVKSVSGPARHVGEADKRVRDSRGGSPCGENRCGIGECREGEGTRGLANRIIFGSPIRKSYIVFQMMTAPEINPKGTP